MKILLVSVDGMCPDTLPNIKDISPTITKLLGVEANAEWEGHSLV